MPYEVVVQPVAEAELEACAIATSGRTRRSGPRVGGGRSSQRRKVSVAGRRAVRSRRRTAPSATKCASSSWAPTASSSPSTRVPAAYTSSTCTTALDDLWVKRSPENETPRHSDDAQGHRAVLTHPAGTQAELPPSGLSHGPSPATGPTDVSVASGNADMGTGRSRGHAKSCNRAWFLKSDSIRFRSKSPLCRARHNGQVVRIPARFGHQPTTT